MGDDLNMRFAPARAALHRMSAAAAEFDGAWARDRGEITDGESGIGGDRLGRAFAAGYAHRAAPARTMAGRMPGLYEGMSRTGHACAADYEAADARSAARFDPA
ncbi:hypothetical protein M8C13_36130 [Crossiella sp. SN42]|uniref:hypothetical protein n=1 Tax=Crossiella sp. SN42 TaxID=2944808 RepID=UPI00207C3315|nr:hypothetical protein [Crossiella sp. SN42]MCO1581193.1 hypothetical protein [Crossiella sp. SN42]